MKGKGIISKSMNMRSGRLIGSLGRRKGSHETFLPKLARAVPWMDVLIKKITPWFSWFMLRIFKRKFVIRAFSSTSSRIKIPQARRAVFSDFIY